MNESELNLHPDHLNDLQKSGLSSETITAANIYSVPPRYIRKILGKDLSEKVDSLLAFPYGQNGFCRFKLFPPLKDKSGHKIKYFQPSGSGIHLYYPPGIEDKLTDPSLPLSFVEGEKKSLKGAQEGIYSIGLGGIWNFKEKGSDELAPDFDTISLHGRVVNLIPDGDYHRNKDIQKAVLFLAQKLKEKGASPYLISLPDGEEKIGLDDFLVRFGISEFWDLPHEEIKTDPYERLNLPSSLDVSEMNVRVEYIVGGGFIPKDSIINIHSLGGVGKSHLMYELGTCVAEGKPFFELPVKQMAVYYIDFENPLSEIVERVKRIGGSENMKIWHLGLDPMPVKFDSDQWEIFKSFPPGLFIVDSLRSSNNLEENSSRDAEFYMDRIKQIRREGSTIALIQHESKMGGYRGSTAWYDLADHVLKFARVKSIGSDQAAEEENFDLPLRLSLDQKSRFSSGVDFKPMYFKFLDRRLILATDPEISILEKMAGHIGGGIYYSPFLKAIQEDVELRQGDKKMGVNRFNRLLAKGEKVVPALWKKSERPEHGKKRIWIETTGT